MEKDREQGNLITGKFTFDQNKSKCDEKVMPKNQTNPLFKQLFKLMHAKIDRKVNYKSFSDFKPKDLR